MAADNFFGWVAEFLKESLFEEKQESNQKPTFVRPLNVGDVCTVEDWTLLDKGDSSEFYDGNFTMTFLTSDCMLIIVSHENDRTRVMNLASGDVGTVLYSALVPYKW